MGGVSRGMRGTGGRSILVRIPWTPRAARKSRIAARAPRKQRYFAKSAHLALWGSPWSSPGGAAARRAAIPSRARMYATVPWARRRKTTRPRAGGAARASFRRRAETADAAPSGPRACAGRRRARVPRRGRGGAPQTARGLRPERRPGAGGRRPRTRLRGPAAGTARGPGAGRRERVRRRRHVRRASGPRNRSPTPRRLREGARRTRPRDAGRWRGRLCKPVITVCLA